MNVIFAWRLKLQILTWSERHVAKSKSSSETCVQFTFTINAIAMVHANVNATLQLAFDVIKKHVGTTCLIITPGRQRSLGTISNDFPTIRESRLDGVSVAFSQMLSRFNKPLRFKLPVINKVTFAWSWNEHGSQPTSWHALLPQIFVVVVFICIYFYIWFQPI